MFSLCVLIANSDLPKDHLGDFYMEMNFSSSHNGQHFTPSSVSYLMAELNLSNIKECIQNKGYASIDDPACGAGSTFLACIKYCLKHNINPQKQIFVHGQDIDKIVALMCYVQLCMWHIPCEIIIGDTLKNESREIWYSPAYHLGFWKTRLKTNKQILKNPHTEVNFLLIGETYT